MLHDILQFQTSRVQKEGKPSMEGSMEGEPVVQIALVAESTRLQMMLSTYGIATQTAREIEPVQIWSSWRMVKVFECLGRNTKLRLSGRPPRPLGSLNTSKIFRVFGDTVVCYPLLFEVSDFYVTADPAVLIEDIKRELAFVAKRWKLAGRPTFCLILREDNVMGEHFDQMLELLVNLKNGFINGIRVRVGRVHQLLSAACIEHIDFASAPAVNFENMEPFQELNSSSATLPELKMAECYLETDYDLAQSEFSNLSDDELRNRVTGSSDKLRTQAFAICELWSRHSGDYEIRNVKISIQLESIYRQAEVWKLWWLVRLCAAKLCKTIDSLAPSITGILVRGKRVTFGCRGKRELTVFKPLTPREIVDLVFESCVGEPLQLAVLQQELLIACADLIMRTPSSFDGMLTIRIGWIAEAVEMMLEYGCAGGWLACIRNSSTTKSTLYDLAPTVIKEIVSSLLLKTNWDLLSPAQIRRLNGSLNRVPISFYDRVWKILERCSKGIVIANKFLPQQPTLSDMTAFELTFAVKVEAMMSEITHPEYRQTLVELMCVISTILERNPELCFDEKLDVDSLILEASQTCAQDRNMSDKSLFYQLETETISYLTKVVINKLLCGENMKNVELNLVSDVNSCLVS